MSPFALVNRLLSPGGSHARLTIMIFHRVLPAPDQLLPFEPDAVTFERRMRQLREWFNVLPLDDAVTRLRNATLPPRALSITFDDGYADNHDVALPILRSLGMHATFFIATGFLDGGCMWNDKIIESIRCHADEALDLRALGLGLVRTRSIDDRIAAIDTVIRQIKYLSPGVRDRAAEGVVRMVAAKLPSGLMMTRQQVRALISSGMGLGAHTRRHPILAGLDAADAIEEIASSKMLLEELSERPVSLFAYPNGKPGKDYSPANVEQVRRLGFSAACSTAAGAATRDSDLFQLPRYTPWGRETWKFGARLSNNLRSRPAEVAR
jgi:peptidoglycan/xylan/chitin deacetylase (PgdA/CDA1 family)